jgi:hypothetical protein
MHSQKTRRSQLVVPSWVLPITAIGLGLYLAWVAIGPLAGMTRPVDTEVVLSDSTGFISDTKDYLERTERLQQAIQVGDPEVIQRAVAEQEALNRRMQDRLAAKLKSEEKERADLARVVRRERIRTGVIGALLLSFGIWTLASRRSRIAEQAA